MGKPTGFIEIAREQIPHRPVAERLQDWRDVTVPLPVPRVEQQAARCMDCGIPFCQAGCPLGNLVPEWNDAVYQGRWEEAYRLLRATNNFPEFTGRICPAPCESACVLGIHQDPVSIEHIEQSVSEAAWDAGWIQPMPPSARTGRSVAVIGSGPAGLACADQLNAAGHAVTVFERHDRVGGLLRYGIPDFKLEKSVLDRRIGLMEAEGIRFETGVEVGVSLPVDALDAFDAIVLCGGATRPRDLPAPGRDLDGVYFAWDYLTAQNRRVAGDTEGVDPVTADGRDVIVIGGGDTGSDCVGTANRQGARSVNQFELLETPSAQRRPDQPWPFMPTLLKTTSSHEEGADRAWGIRTVAFEGSRGRLTHLRTVRVRPGPGARIEDVPDTEAVWPADLVLLAVGYLGPESTLSDALQLELDPRGNVRTDAAYRTSRDGVFAAGDQRRGQSLVVWAISEGREAARCVDEWLAERTVLPTAGPGVLPRL